MQIHILYLHGYNSSPQSEKAQLTKRYFTKHFPDIIFHCPQIVSHPQGAITQFENIIETANSQAATIDNHQPIQWVFIGSSLGGYFATYLSEKYKSPAILINPAVKPYELLIDYLGEQTNTYTQEVYQVDKSFIGHLKALEKSHIDKKNYLLLVQTGDEVLDYRQAIDKYKNAQIIEQQGGDHSFIDYENMLPTMASFLQKMSRI